MSFREQGWSARYAALGDQAEAAFEEWATEQGLGFMRFGLDRPNLHVPSIPQRLRYMPDYLCNEHFVEVQGCGRDQTTKLKLSKWGSLHWWSDLHDVSLFFHDSHKRRNVLLSLWEYDALLGEATLGSFPEGHVFFSLPADVVFDG